MNDVEETPELQRKCSVWAEHHFMVTVLLQLLLILTDNYVYIVVFKAKSLANGVIAKVCGAAETFGHVKLAHIYPVGVF